MPPTTVRPITRELPGSLYELARAWQSRASDSDRARSRMLERGMPPVGERGPAADEESHSAASEAEPIG